METVCERNVIGYLGNSYLIERGSRSVRSEATVAAAVPRSEMEGPPRPPNSLRALRETPCYSRNHHNYRYL